MAGNPNYSKVSLQLNCDGAVDSTTFTDVGPTGRTVTTYTGAKVIADYEFGRALSLDGFGYLEAAASSDFNFGSGDFAIECFAYFIGTHPPTSYYKGLVVCDDIGVSRGWLLLLDGDTTNKLEFSFLAGATSYSVVAGSVPALNTWYHIAVTRSSTNLRMFLNGVLQSTTDVGTTALNDTSAIPLEVGSLRISSAANAPTRPVCRLTGIRITKGAAVYTSAFTPPALPLDGQQYLITGTVEDATGTPAARKVIAVIEATDKVVHTTTSDGTTGAYRIESNASTAHTVTAYPAGGEALPALVLRGVVPIES